MADILLATSFAKTSTKCLFRLSSRGSQANFELYIVDGDSMSPSLRSGDLLIVHKNAYRTDLPERGDVVVAQTRNELIVKRIVGLPGETIELRHGQLYVNGSHRVEHYPVHPGWLSLGPGKMFDDRYALLGDNRALHVSLSVHAVLARDQVLGKVVRSFRLRPVSPSAPIEWSYRISPADRGRD